jgi:hypothetical protein
MKPNARPGIFLGLISLFLIFVFPMPEKGWGLDDSIESQWKVEGMYNHCASRNKTKAAIKQCCQRKVDDCRNACDKDGGCKNRCNKQFNYCDSKTEPKRTSLGTSGRQSPSGEVQQTPPPSPFRSQFNIRQFMQRFTLRSRGIENLPPPVIPDPIPPALPNFELEKKDSKQP